MFTVIFFSLLSFNAGMSGEISPWLNKMARHTYHTQGDIFTIRQSDNIFQKTYSLQFETKLPFRPIIYPPATDTLHVTNQQQPETYDKIDTTTTGSDDQVIESKDREDEEIESTTTTTTTIKVDNVR